MRIRSSCKARNVFIQIDRLAILCELEVFWSNCTVIAFVGLVFWFDPAISVGSTTQVESVADPNHAYQHILLRAFLLNSPVAFFVLINHRLHLIEFSNNFRFCRVK